MQTVGFLDGKIMERFDCYEGTSKDLYVQGVNFFARKPDTLAGPDYFKVKLSKDLYVQGVNFFARKPETLAGPDYLPTEGNRAECLSERFHIALSRIRALTE